MAREMSLRGISSLLLRWLDAVADGIANWADLNPDYGFADLERIGRLNPIAASPGCHLDSARRI